MVLEGIIEYLSALGIHEHRVEGAWVQASCPAAFARHKGGRDSNPSFGISLVEDGKSGYNCFACGLKGNDLGDLLVELQHEAKVHGYVGFDLAKARAVVAAEDEMGYVPHEWTDDPVGKVFEPWPEWYLEGYRPAWAHPAAREYLLSRGVSADVCTRLDLRHDAKRDMVCFPVRHRSGALSGMRGRSISQKRHHDYVWNGINNTSLVLYGEHHIYPMRPVVVVEGPFDLARVYPHYSNVVALFMASINKARMATLSLAVQVLAMTDSDLAGEQVFWHLRDVLPNTVRIGIVSDKKDPSEMSADEVRSALSQYVRLDPVKPGL